MKVYFFSIFNLYITLYFSVLSTIRQKAFVDPGLNLSFRASNNKITKSTSLNGAVFLSVFGLLVKIVHTLFENLEEWNMSGPSPWQP